VIRGPVAPMRGGSRGSGPRSVGAGAGALGLPLPAAMRPSRHRGPGRARVASDFSSRPPPEGFGRIVQSSACQSPDLFG